MYTKSLGKCATVAATKTVLTAWDRSQIIEVWRPNNVMWLLVRACAGVTGGQRKTSLQVNGHQTMGYQLKESVWVHHTCDGVCRGERWTETDNIAGEWRTSRDGLLKKHVWVHHTCEGMCRSDRWKEEDNIAVAGEWTSRDGLLIKEAYMSVP